MKEIFIFSHLIILSLYTLALRAEVTDQELDQFVYRYLNDYNEKESHCRDGYCYYILPIEDTDYNPLSEDIGMIKIEENAAKAIVKSLLREYEVLEDLAEIRTSPELLPYLEKYRSLKIESTGRSIQPDIKIVFAGDGSQAGGFCHFSSGLVLIQPITGSCFQNDAYSTEFLILHELTHCDLGRHHHDYNYDAKDNNINPSGFFSFMNLKLLDILSNNSCDERFGIEDDSQQYLLPDFDRSHVEANFGQLYTELFSRDQFYHDEGFHIRNYPYNTLDFFDDYRSKVESYVERKIEEEKVMEEVEDLGKFTNAVENDLLQYKQMLQQLIQER